MVDKYPTLLKGDAADKEMEFDLFSESHQRKELKRIQKQNEKKGFQRGARIVAIKTDDDEPPAHTLITEKIREKSCSAYKKTQIGIGKSPIE